MPSGKRCLLAPVPIVHLPGAEQRASAVGRVAFGSSKIDFFEKLETDACEGLDVFIVASKTAHDPGSKAHSSFRIGQVVLRGLLQSVDPADEHGKHSDAAERPDTALGGDDAFVWFWVVTALARVKQPLAVSRFANASGRRWEKTPRGPTIAWLQE